MGHAKSSKQYVSTSRGVFFLPFSKSLLILIPRESFKKSLKNIKMVVQVILRKKTTSSKKHLFEQN